MPNAIATTKASVAVRPPRTAGAPLLLPEEEDPEVWLSLVPLLVPVPEEPLLLVAEEAPYVLVVTVAGAV